VEVTGSSSYAMPSPIDNLEGKLLEFGKREADASSYTRRVRVASQFRVSPSANPRLSHPKIPHDFVCAFDCELATLI
jgi:hypothetical protein